MRFRGLLAGITFGAMVLLPACHGHDSAAPRRAPAPRDRAPAATVTSTSTPSSELEFEFGDAPQLDPVERMLSAWTNGFDVKLFASAFRNGATCGLEDYAAGRLPDALKMSTSQIDAVSARVTNESSDTASVVISSLLEQKPLVIPVRLTGGTWFVDGNPCTLLDAAFGTTRDRAAQSDLRNALVAAKVQYTDEGTYTGVTPQSLARIEPSVSYGDLAAASTATVGIGDLGPVQLVLVTQSVTGTWFCIATSPRGHGTTYGQGGARENVDSVAECQGPPWK
jgi:hypothetical protein